METMLKQIHQMMDFIPGTTEVECDYCHCDDYPFLNAWASARDTAVLYYDRDKEEVVFVAQSYDGHNGNSFDRVNTKMGIYGITSSLMNIIYDRMLELVKARISEIRHEEQQQRKEQQDKKILEDAGLSFIHP